MVTTVVGAGKSEARTHRGTWPRGSLQRVCPWLGQTVVSWACLGARDTSQGQSSGQGAPGLASHPPPPPRAPWYRSLCACSPFPSPPVLFPSLPPRDIGCLSLSSRLSVLYHSPMSVTLSGGHVQWYWALCSTVCVSEDLICPSVSPWPSWSALPPSGRQISCRRWRVWAGGAGRVLWQPVWSQGPRAAPARTGHAPGTSI